MITVRLLLASLFLAASISAGAQSPAQAGLCLINAVDDAEPVTLRLGKLETRPEGYPCGLASGWVNLRPGTHVITAKHPAFGSATLSVKLKAGEARAVIILLKPKSGSTKGKVLRFLTLRASQAAPPADGKAAARNLTFVSVAPAETLPIRAGALEATLTRYEPQTLTLPPRAGGRLTVKHEDTSIGTIDFEEPGDRYIVIHNDPSGSLATMVFQGLLKE